MIVESYEDVIVLSGPLTAGFWDAVQTAIALTLRRNPTGVIVDCSQITKINEEGAKTFQSAIDYVLEHDGARIIFAGVPDAVMDVLRSVPAVRSQLALADSVEDARTSLNLFESKETKKRRLSEETRSKHILAVVCPNECDAHFLKTIAEHLSTAPAHLVILFPIIVPRDLPLHAPVPEEEHKLFAFAEKAREMFANTESLAEVRLERTRDIPALVAEIAEEINAQQVIVSIAASHDQDSDSARNFGALLTKIKQPLVFVRSGCDQEQSITN